MYWVQPQSLSLLETGNNLKELFRHTELGDTLNAEALALDVSIRSNLLSYQVRRNDGRCLAIAAFQPDGAILEDERQLLDWLKSEPLFKEPFNTVQILWNEPRLTLVPQELFDANEITRYIQPVFDMRDAELLLHAEQGEYIALFPVPQALYYALKSRWTNVQHRNQLQVNMELCLRSDSISEGVCALIDPDFIHLVLTENGKLQFQNAIAYSTATEAAYFILNFFEQNKFNRNSTPITFLGITGEHDIIRNLQNYLADIRFYRPAGLPADSPLILDSFLSI